jgi:hypothetical protein
MALKVRALTMPRAVGGALYVFAVFAHKGVVAFAVSVNKIVPSTGTVTVTVRDFALRDITGLSFPTLVTRALAVETVPMEVAIV